MLAEGLRKAGGWRLFLALAFSLFVILNLSELGIMRDLIAPNLAGAPVIPYASLGEWLAVQPVTVLLALFFAAVLTGCAAVASAMPGRTEAARSRQRTSFASAASVSVFVAAIAAAAIYVQMLLDYPLWHMLAVAAFAAALIFALWRQGRS
ncbi:hypothetical protein COU20_02570 [Candidatus Kaiserbacteria bacterium CG10_big_fil_rev_8_21_14_0_10_59_10]|uniref:Uncharacterized protein n=1 Tax=Candidatus Kaiserbacteria bacterium CG10_big_fil_rev_8_21_14_0_10_59_10 TaxID=1974612 RepID=A0A2H0U7J6_9BACT|nr:MAG: hypothetical protein COU20_02570 [Candidatus Kaiserbacteria bacterium CG10_big_fil_rev_8_21_14_0_10_59_10]